GEESMHIHVIQRGETLWGIAEQYGVDLNQIILLNQFDDPNALVVGEAIVIPERGWEYVVQPGDQLWSIAQRFGVTVEELAQENHLTNPELIYVGKMLQLPISYMLFNQGKHCGPLVIVTACLWNKLFKQISSKILHLFQLVNRKLFLIETTHLHR